MHEWKGKRVGQIAKKRAHPAVQPAASRAYRRLFATLSHGWVSTRVLWSFKPILGHAPSRMKGT